MNITIFMHLKVNQYACTGIKIEVYTLDYTNYM